MLIHKKNDKGWVFTPVITIIQEEEIGRIVA
jgi:hypothetical protein